MAIVQHLCTILVRWLPQRFALFEPVAEKGQPKALLAKSNHSHGRKRPASVCGNDGCRKRKPRGLRTSRGPFLVLNEKRGGLGRYGPRAETCQYTFFTIRARAPNANVKRVNSEGCAVPPFAFHTLDVRAVWADTQRNQRWRSQVASGKPKLKDGRANRHGSPIAPSFPRSRKPCN